MKKKEGALSDGARGREDSGRKRSSARERDRKYRDHLRQLVLIQERMQGKSAMYGGAVMEEPGQDAGKKPFYRRYWRSVHNNRFRYWHKISNRKVRRYQGDIHHTGASYRKVFDYWRTVD